MNFLNLKLALILSLLTLITQNGVAHSGSFYCLIREFSCEGYGAYIPDTLKFNPNLSTGSFSVSIDGDYIGWFDYLGRVPKNGSLSDCKSFRDSRSKAQKEARRFAAELKAAGMCSFVLEDKTKL